MGPIVYMVSTKLLVGLLGIGLTFAPDAIYTFYEHQPRTTGASARATTRRSPALIMALEQSIVMGIALVWLFVRVLAQSERRGAAPERYAAAARAPRGRQPRATMRALRRRPRRSGSVSQDDRRAGQDHDCVPQLPRPSPIVAPSPIATGPGGRTCSPICPSAPTHTGGSIQRDPVQR